MTLTDTSLQEDYFKGWHRVQVPPHSWSGWARQGDWVRANIREGTWMYAGNGLFFFKREQDLTWFKLRWSDAR